MVLSLHFRRENFTDYDDFSKPSAIDAVIRLNVSHVSGLLLKDTVAKNSQSINLFCHKAGSRRHLATIEGPSRSAVCRAITSHLALDILPTLVESFPIPFTDDNISAVAAFPELRHPYGYGTRRIRVTFPPFALGSFEKPNERLPLISLSLLYDLALTKFLTGVYSFKSVRTTHDQLLRLVERHLQDFRSIL